MPRLSNDLYLRRHVFLARAWQDFARLYTILLPQDQWTVHRFYQPTKDLSDQELLDYRQQITSAEPGLPARAGRLFIRMNRAFRTAYEYAQGDQLRFYDSLWQQTAGAKAQQHGKRRIRIAALARPEPDLEALARVLVQMAIDQVKAEEAARAGN